MEHLNTSLSKPIGEYNYYSTCRFCFSSKVKKVIDLGPMPLAGGFLKSDKSFNSEKFYPLELNFCKNCFLLQCNSAVSPTTLFKDYFYFSSTMTTLITHFNEQALNLKNKFSSSKNKFIVEIGCNDGAFISALQKNNFKALGVDPATNIVTPLIKKGLPIINNFFNESVATDIIATHGKADAIYSFHAMAHIEDMHSVVRGIKTLLAEDGFLAFEVHYLGNLIEEFQYDMIYHEHEYYYSLLALINFFKQFDMEIYDVERSPIRAGSIMYYVQHKKTGKRKKTTRFYTRTADEQKKKLDNSKTFLDFSKKIIQTKIDLLLLLNSLKKQGKTVAGYGASGRGTIIMNYCNLSEEYLPYVIDDSPAKWGSYTPGTHQKIVSSEILSRKDHPDYVVLFAWPFAKEVLKRNQIYIKNGGKFILPLPHVKIIS